MSLETPNQAVNPAESAPAEQAVNQAPAETTATESTATSETNEQSQGVTQESQPTVNFNGDLYDERGVPYKNVAMEFKRKYEETQSNLPKLIAEEVAKLTTQHTQKKYTIAELEQFAQANPEHRAWVEEEKAKVIESNLVNKVQQINEQAMVQQRGEQVKAQTFNQVISQFPEIAIRDQQGNFMGWNNLSPLTQAIGRYMSNPDLANRPEGLMIAAKLAYADSMMSKLPQTQKQVQALKSQVRKAQAQGMVEGGGKRVGAENPNRKLMERVKQTGKIEDAAAVMGNILRATGQMKG